MTKFVNFGQLTIKIINWPIRNILVRPLLTVVSITFAALLTLSFVPQAFANDMNGILIPQKNKAEGHFIAFYNLELKYPAGSPIAQELEGKNERIQFKVSGDADSTNGIPSAMIAFNNAFIENKSPVHVTQIDVAYTATIKGDVENALISYKIETKPVLENFVISAGSEGNLAGDIVDLEFRSISVKDPITLESPEFGMFEINKPINMLKVTHPELAAKIENSEARVMFEEPILNFEAFDLPMERWHFLFDPSGSLVESSAFFREESGAKVTSIYSLGESSFREGTFEAEEKDMKGTIDGTEVLFHSQVPAPSGQIQIAGFSKIQTSEAGEFAIVTAEAPEGAQAATGGFPIQVLLVLGGMMGAIAVFILFKARK